MYDSFLGGPAVPLAAAALIRTAYPRPSFLGRAVRARPPLPPLMHIRSGVDSGSRPQAGCPFYSGDDIL